MLLRVILEYTKRFRGTNLDTLWFDISKDPRITLEMVYTTPEYDPYWNYRGLSQNPNLSIDHLVNNPNQDWDWDFLSLAPQISIIGMIAHRHQFPWNWRLISRYTVTWNLIVSHDFIPWDLTEFLCNIRMNARLLSQNLFIRRWNFDAISETSFVNISTLLIPGALHLSWNWKKLSRNPNFSLAIILKHNTLPWDWEYVVTYRKMDIHLVFSNPKIPYKWAWLTRSTMLNNSITSLRLTEETFYKVLHHCHLAGPDMRITITPSAVNGPPSFSVTSSSHKTKING